MLQHSDNDHFSREKLCHSKMESYLRVKYRILMDQTKVRPQWNDDVEIDSVYSTREAENIKTTTKEHSI